VAGTGDDNPAGGKSMKTSHIATGTAPKKTTRHARPVLGAHRDIRDKRGRRIAGARHRPKEQPFDPFE
jgi:hypothetical protein